MARPGVGSYACTPHFLNVYYAPKFNYLLQLGSTYIHTHVDTLGMMSEVCPFENVHTYTFSVMHFHLRKLMKEKRLKNC